MQKMYFFYILPSDKVVSIILPSRQRDIPIFKYKLRMVRMWVICKANILEQFKTKK